jgi:hypothetical protein
MPKLAVSHISGLSQTPYLNSVLNNTLYYVLLSSTGTSLSLTYLSGVHVSITVKLNRLWAHTTPCLDLVRKCRDTRPVELVSCSKGLKTYALSPICETVMKSYCAVPFENLH